MQQSPGGDQGLLHGGTGGQAELEARHIQIALDDLDRTMAAPEQAIEAEAPEEVVAAAEAPERGAQQVSRRD